MVRGAWRWWGGACIQGARCDLARPGSTDSDAGERRRPGASGFLTVSPPLALLEGYAAGQAATRISEADLAVLQESCDRFDAIAGDDVRELVRENMLFHSTIHAAAESPRLSGMIRRVIELPLVYKSYVWYSPDQKRISAHYHRQITRAFEARDGERAELVMKEHVFEARDILVAHVRDLEEQP